MEEVKCCLLGFTSELLEQALHVSSSTTTAAAPANAEAPLHLSLRSLPFHPTEQALLQRVLPLGRSYRLLRQATQDVAVGRTEGLYPAAVGSGIKKIVDLYVDAVKRASTPAALAALPDTYATAFSLLEEIVAAQQRTEVCLPLLDRFLQQQEIPSVFRRLLGESVWLAILYTTAHYVAHGVVLHARPDYFISLQAKPTSSTSGKAQAAEEHTLYVDRLPRGVSSELGLLILAAGKERRVLLRDAEVQGGSDYLEQLALGSQDEAANAVFHSIFNVQLCHGGVLAAEELAARVEAAKSLWSKALWMKVGDLPALREHLTALRSVFLCHRGDIWYAFVERVLPVLAASHLTQKGALGTAATSTAGGAAILPPLPDDGDGDDVSGDELLDEADADDAATRAAAMRCAYLQRTAADAFLYALSVSNLRDVAVYDTFTMRVSASGLEEADAALVHANNLGDRGNDSSGAASAEAGKRGSRRRRWAGRTASTEDVARHLLRVVQAMYVQYIPPQGLPLMVSPKAMHYYQRMLTFHLALRFALQALAVTRALFSEALVTNAKPSADLRRAFTLFHLLHFLQSTVAYYMQVDVISVCTARLEAQLASSTCASVEQAKRLHDQFIWSVAEATFLTDGSEAVLAACQALNTCSVTLYTLCTRYRIPYWAVEGINATPIEVRATLEALETRVQQEVVAVFTGHLGLGGRQWERALWGRLDFNKYFSQHRARPLPPTHLRSSGSGSGGGGGGGGSTTAQTAFAQPSAASRSRSSGAGARAVGSAGAATTATTTPRRLRSSSKRAGGG